MTTTLNLEDQARAAAATFRQEHELGLAPLPDLVALIESTQGIDVAVLNAGSDSHGMTLRDPERNSVMVAAARTRHPMRQRSTLAHELAHMIFDDYATPRTQGWGQRDPEEIRADNFARHLLVPLEGLTQASHLPEGRAPDLSTLSALAQHFQASPQIVTIQLAHLGLISADLKRDWMATTTAPMLAAKFGWSDQYRAMQQESDTRRAPQRLTARAIRGYQQGIVSIAYIARLRGMDVAEVEAEFNDQGIKPGSEDATPDSAKTLRARLTPPDDNLHDIDLSDLDALGLDEELPPE